jgi:hypothetical protein
LKSLAAVGKLRRGFPQNTYRTRTLNYGTF